MTTRFSQNIRRYSAVTLCAVASLVLAACGGGSSGPSSSRLDTTVPFSERAESGDQAGNQNTDGLLQSEQGSSSGGHTDDADQTASDNDSGDQLTDNDSKADDDTNDELVDSGSTTDDATSNDDWQESVDEVYEEVVSKVDGLVTLEWYRPQYRENGDVIRDGDIGGYELRYRQVGAQEARSIVLDGEWELEYELEGLKPGEYEFSVAAYDRNGLYSEFVGISPVK